MAEKAPQAEALAASWIIRMRPTLVTLYAVRRRIATISAAVAACLLFVHVMFGANGMLVYKQKKAEYETLRKQIVRVGDENEQYKQQIRGLKTDEKAIEKEAREQMHYARPGEYVYVPPAPPNPQPASNNSAKR